MPHPSQQTTVANLFQIVGDNFLCFSGENYFGKVTFLHLMSENEFMGKNII